MKKEVKKKETPSIKKEALKVGAVDRLIEANAGKAEDVKEEDIKNYKSGKLQNIPAWLKALFIKYWFNGAICFFFLLGLGNVISDQWSLILVLGFGAGVVIDLLVNNCFRFLESSDHEFYPYMMFTKKKFYTLFANIIYAIICTICVVKIYDLINSLIVNANPTKYISEEGTKVPIAVEPLLYGLFYLIVDMTFISIKNLFKKILFKKKLMEEIN